MRGWFGIVCIERYRLFFCRQEISGKLEEIREKLTEKKRKEVQKKNRTGLEVIRNNKKEGSAEKESNRIRSNQK